MTRNGLARFMPLVLGLGLALALAPHVRAEDDDDDDAPESADQVLAREHGEVSHKLSALMEETHKAFQQKDYDAVSSGLERALKAIESLKVQKQVKDEWEARIRYDMTCELSLLGKTDDALKELARTLELGYSDWAHIAEDTDLDAIRKEDAFKKAIEKAKAALREKGAAEAKKALEEKPILDLDLELKTLDGKVLKLADFKGKVVVLDLWTTRTHPRAQTQIGCLVQLYERYKKNGLEVIGIACESRGEDGAREDVSAFAKEHKVGYPLALGNRKQLNKKIPGIAGLPTTLYLDREGKVRMRKFGMSDTNSGIEWFEGAIGTLLEAKGESGK